MNPLKKKIEFHNSQLQLMDRVDYVRLCWISSTSQNSIYDRLANVEFKSLHSVLILKNIRVLWLLLQHVNSNQNINKKNIL